MYKYIWKIKQQNIDLLNEERTEKKDIRKVGLKDGIRKKREEKIQIKLRKNLREKKKRKNI